MVTGSPMNRPASDVPFDAPGTLRETPSIEMSVIVLMVGVEPPYETSSLLVALDALVREVRERQALCNQAIRVDGEEADRDCAVALERVVE